MSRRNKSRQRSERRSDPLESLRPLVVLGLLGMILYGAYSIIQKGPSRPAPDWQGSDAAADAGDAPPFAAAEPAAPQVELGGPAVTAAAVPGTAAAIPQPRTPAVATATPPSPTAEPQPGPSGQPPAGPAVKMPAATAAAEAAEAEPAVEPAQLAPTYIDAVAAMPPKPAVDSAVTQPAGAGKSPAAGAGGNNSAAFTAAWADAHDKLEGGRYAEALAILSVWYDDDSLSSEESRQLETLLGQLAGTVIYSTQDLLLPPHIAAAGETLEGIAKPLEVPAALLANINGVGPEGPAAGQALKVLRGPFDGVVSLSRRRLSLQVGGRYAGSFTAAIGSGFVARSGSSVRLVEIRRQPPPAPDRAVPVAYQPGQGPAILLSEGLSIEPADGPGFIARTPADNLLLVSAADFADLADILGAGSQVLIRP